jgi:hypothetical protein
MHETTAMSFWMRYLLTELNLSLRLFIDLFTTAPVLIEHRSDLAIY